MLLKFPDINKDDFGDPVNDTAATSTTFAVVTTEKQVKVNYLAHLIIKLFMVVCLFFFAKCYHHFLKKNDSLRNGIDLTNSLKTGVLMLNGEKFCVKNIFHYGAAIYTDADTITFYICTCTLYR